MSVKHFAMGDKQVKNPEEFNNVSISSGNLGLKKGSIEPFFLM
jgi:hypothetical protein